MQSKFFAFTMDSIMRIFFGGFKHPQAHTHTHPAHSHLHAHTQLHTQPRARACRKPRDTALQPPLVTCSALPHGIAGCTDLLRVAPIRCMLQRFVARCTDSLHVGTICCALHGAPPQRLLRAGRETSTMQVSASQCGLRLRARACACTRCVFVRVRVRVHVACSCVCVRACV